MRSVFHHILGALVLAFGGESSRALNGLGVRRVYGKTCVWKAAHFALVAVCVSLFAIGCASKQKGMEAGRPGDSGYLVRSLKIDGMKHVNADELRSVLATRALSLNPFGSNRPLNRYELHNDVERIETFYQLNGYFDARVIGPAEVTYFDDVLRANVRFTVEEGEPTRVQDVRILDARTGSLDPVTASASGFGYLISRVNRRLPVRSGQVFTYDDMTEAAALLRRRLQELGYARAVVEARAYVSRNDLEVIVVYSIDPGAVSVFGDVTVYGNDRVPDRVILKAAALEKGTDFRPSLLEDARTRLYGLDEFQVVDIITGLEGNTSAGVDATRGAGASSDKPSGDKSSGDKPRGDQRRDSVPNDAPDTDAPDTDPSDTGTPDNRTPRDADADGETSEENDKSTPEQSRMGAPRGVRVLAATFPEALDPLSPDAASAYKALPSGWGASATQVRHTYDAANNASQRVSIGWRSDAVSAAMDAQGYDAAFAVSAAPEGQETVIAQGGFDFSKLKVEDPHINVDIQVSESAAAAYRFGLGVEIDSGRWAAFARGNAIWRGIFGPLNTFEADLRVGYAWLPTPFMKNLESQDIRNHGVIARTSLTYRRPQLLWNAWDLHAGVRVDREVELAYDLLTLGGDIGIDRRWGQHYHLSLAYSFDYSREDSTLDGGLDAYRLAWLSASAIADFRDNPMQPRKGFYGELLTELGDPFTGEFLFVKLRPDIRGYIPISNRFTLALRGTVGFIFSMPSDDPVPISHRLYEGGSTSFRGVPYKRLSPHRYRLRNSNPGVPSTSVYPNAGDCEQVLDGLTSGGVGSGYSCRPEPTGGFFSAVVTVEPRYEIGKDWLFGALFVEAGTVQNQVVPRFRLHEDDWHLALGAGLRIATPLGPIRADLAYRFTNATAYDSLSKFVFFLAIGEAF